MRVCCSNNDPIDFCKKHYPSESVARDEYGNMGDGPDNRGNCFEYEADHPPYDGNDYLCYICGKTLYDDIDY